MAKSAMAISAFGDEISDSLDEQLWVLRELGIGYLEVRGVWGKNVLHLTDAEVEELRATCDAAQVKVSAIGSPVGKSPITQPLATELTNLARIFAIAERLGTRMMRVFSFYPPVAPEAAWSEADLLDEATMRLAAMAEAAGAAGLQLVLENEYGIVGDSVAHCQTLLERVNSPHLAFAWDPANFVHAGEAASVTSGWEMLGPRTQHVHVKDYRLATGKTMGEVLPAGEGDGQIPQLLTKLGAAGYGGRLALEPHLAFAGKSSGFSGPEGMARAAHALRAVMAQVGIDEAKAQLVA
jgi:sugar phosphate isomerase/epimerase